MCAIIGVRKHLLIIAVLGIGGIQGVD